MASWSPRTIAAASWLFPVVSGGFGLYSATVATNDLLSLLIAAAALVLGSLVGVATSNSGNRFTTGLAVAAAIPFVLSGRQGVDLVGVLASYGVGLAIVWALRLSRGEDHRDLLPTMIRRLGGYVTYAVVY